MKYEERFVLTIFEAAATAFMALGGIQMKRCGVWRDIVFCFSWSLDPPMFRWRGYEHNVTILLKAAGSF